MKRTVIRLGGEFTRVDLYIGIVFGLEKDTLEWVEVWRIRNVSREWSGRGTVRHRAGVR